jgi:hypothetical protein
LDIDLLPAPLQPEPANQNKRANLIARKQNPLLREALYQHFPERFGHVVQHGGGQASTLYAV